jgi:hypothetical protein
MRSPNLGSRLFSPQKLQVRRRTSSFRESSACSASEEESFLLIECETQGCGFPKL